MEATAEEKERFERQALRFVALKCVPVLLANCMLYEDMRQVNDMLNYICSDAYGMLNYVHEHKDEMQGSGEGDPAELPDGYYGDLDGGGAS